MRRPKGVITIRFISKCAGVSEQTVTNHAKLLCIMLEKETSKSMTNGHTQEIIIVKNG